MSDELTQLEATIQCLLNCYPDGCRYESQRDDWVARILAHDAIQRARIETLEAGTCIKCNMGPMLTSCAYPEACEHPGRQLALIYNQSLLTVAEQNGTIRALAAKLAEVEQERNQWKEVFERSCDDAAYNKQQLQAMTEERDEWKRRRAQGVRKVIITAKMLLMPTTVNDQFIASCEDLVRKLEQAT